MSEKNSSVAIGAFLVGALIIALSALLFVAGSGFNRDKSMVVMVFDGSVKGLSVGAPVALRGVEIGNVTNIHLIFDTDTIDVIMLVEAEILGDQIQRRGANDGDFTEDMIARGLRAQLNTQSLLTGLLYVQLDFHPGAELNLAEINSPYTQIPTIPTDLQRLSRQFEALDFASLAMDLQMVADSLSAFVSSEGFAQIPTDLHNTLASVEALSEQLNQALAGSVPKLDAVLEQANTTVALANKAIPELTGSAASAMTQLEEALASFGQTMDSMDQFVSEDSPTRYELDKALRELAMAGRSLKLLAKTLEEQPESLLRGKSGDEE